MVTIRRTFGVHHHPLFTPRGPEGSIGHQTKLSPLFIPYPKLWPLRRFLFSMYLFSMYSMWDRRNLTYALISSSILPDLVNLHSSSILIKLCKTSKISNLNVRSDKLSNSFHKLQISKGKDANWQRNRCQKPKISDVSRNSWQKWLVSDILQQ